MFPALSELLFLIPLLLGLGLVGCGAFFLWGSVKAHRWLTHARRTWMSTPGTVVESTLGRAWEAESSHNQYYQAHIRYTYTVLGNMYTSTQISLQESKTAHPRPQQTILNRYPAGRHVTVWYDPQAPEHCALELRLGIAIGCLPLLGLFLVLVGLGLFFLAVTTHPAST